MTSMRLLLLGSCAAATLASGCGNVSGDSAPDAATPADAAVDAVDAPGDPQAVRCAHDKPFGKPVRVQGIAAGAWTSARLSDDELTMYVAGVMEGSATASDLFVTRRNRRTDPFDLTRATKPLTASMSGNDNFPTVSRSGLELVFDSQDPMTGARHLWIASRNTPGLAEFDAADAVQGDVRSDGIDTDPFLTADGAELWFSSTRTGGRGNIDLYHVPRVADGFGKAVHEHDLSSDQSDGLPTLSADRLTLYFQSSRDTGDGTPGDYNIWMAHRSTTRDGWPAPALVKEVSSDKIDWPGWLSPDQCRLYLTSDRDGSSQQLYVAERQP